MSTNNYCNLGKQGCTNLSSNKYDLGKGATDMSNNIYGNLGKKGGTSMSEDIYKFDRIHLNEDVIDEINRIRQIL